jgi:hypothetical protein
VTLYSVLRTGYIMIELENTPGHNSVQQPLTSKGADGAGETEGLICNAPTPRSS